MAFPLHSSAYGLSLLPLPGSIQLETEDVLRQLTRSHRQLAELKGAVATIPNESILIDTLTLQEARDSSAVENIITTQDELYQMDHLRGRFSSPAAKEVHNYVEALKIGFARVRRNGFIRLDDILAIQETLEQNRAGLRKLPGTVLKNEHTGEVVYEPPQHPNEILPLMDNFVAYLNRDDAGDPDPLVRMAVLHFQFESIHPFYDGNGRTGRILNLLHLLLHGLLDFPVLYLSRFIVQHKSAYYEGLQAVRTSGAWESWLLYMLKAVEETARTTLALVAAIRELMQLTKHRMRAELPRIYRQELLNTLFRHPYTKIEFVQRDLKLSRPTATKYLQALAAAKILRKQRIGSTNFYINQELFSLLSR